MFIRFIMFKCSYCSILFYNVYNVHYVHYVHHRSFSIISQSTTLFQLQTCLLFSLQLDDYHPTGWHQGHSFTLQANNMVKINIYIVLVSVLLSTHANIFVVSCMQDFINWSCFTPTIICL